jgi:hypothetical protein
MIPEFGVERVRVVDDVSIEQERAGKILLHPIVSSSSPRCETTSSARAVESWFTILDRGFPLDLDRNGEVARFIQTELPEG